MKKNKKKNFENIQTISKSIFSNYLIPTIFLFLLFVPMYIKLVNKNVL